MVPTWVALAVSGPAVLFHAAAAGHHLLENRAAPAPEKITGRGYARTAGSRAAATLVYLTVAAFQAAGARLPGGGLSAGSLVLFTAAQAAGLLGSALDIPLRYRAVRASKADNAGGR